MPFFPSLPDDANIGQIYKLNPDIRRSMSELGRVIMRGDGALTAGHREAIAALVSALNKCDYCYNGHSQIAVNLGTPRDTLDAIVADIDTAPIEPALKPILHYVRKLTVAPVSITQADADAVFAAGWSEKDLHDAIMVCCRFNFMNRMSLGHGLDPDGVDPKVRAERMEYAQKVKS
ncbi:MAG: hypothetical protein RLZ98_654 [Pseudomonadota bacterium]|jgi:uncharacterized peroxidase-related enzyme